MVASVQAGSEAAEMLVVCKLFIQEVKVGASCPIMITTFSYLVALVKTLCPYCLDV